MSAAYMSRPSIFNHIIVYVKTLYNGRVCFMVWHTVSSTIHNMHGCCTLCILWSGRLYTFELLYVMPYRPTLFSWIVCVMHIHSCRLYVYGSCTFVIHSYCIGSRALCIYEYTCRPCRHTYLLILTVYIYVSYTFVIHFTICRLLCILIYLLDVSIVFNILACFISIDLYGLCMVWILNTINKCA